MGVCVEGWSWTKLRETVERHEFKVISFYQYFKQKIVFFNAQYIQPLWSLVLFRWVDLFLVRCIFKSIFIPATRVFQGFVEKWGVIKIVIIPFLFTTLFHHVSSHEVFWMLVLKCRGFISCCKVVGGITSKFFCNDYVSEEPFRLLITLNPASQD